MKKCLADSSATLCVPEFIKSQGNVSSLLAVNLFTITIFSCNSEADASELQENIVIVKMTA